MSQANCGHDTQEVGMLRCQVHQDHLNQLGEESDGSDDIEETGGQPGQRPDHRIQQSSLDLMVRDGFARVPGGQAVCEVGHIDTPLLHDGGVRGDSLLFAAGGEGLGIQIDQMDQAEMLLQAF